MRASFNHLIAAERTHLGLVRENNEDALLCLPRSGLFAVADGMGGAREGEVAAKAVADHLREACEDDSLSLPARLRRCREALNEASVWIRQYAARQGNPGMGATVVALLFDPRNSAQAAVLHAGDSRLYRLRDGALEPITRDHSVAALTGIGQEGRVPALFHGVITRAVGVRRSVEAEINYLDVREGDLFLLCSDGLNGLVPHETLTRILDSGRVLDALAAELVEAALAAGGDDNVTVVLVRVGAGGSPPGPGPETPVGATPASACRSRFRPFPWPPLLGLLTIGALGLLGVWFSVESHRSVRAPTVLQPVAVPVAAVPADPVLPEAASTPSVVPTPEPEPGPSVVSAAESWTRERNEIRADPDRIRIRHAAVVRAFSRLSAWSGMPVDAPSLMILGRQADKPDAWVRYLDQAQERWLAACSNAVARLRTEAACLTPDRLTALWRWTAEPRGDADAAPLEAALVAQTMWVEEVERMARYLAGESGSMPFLYRLPEEVFVPERSAAGLGDRAWGAAIFWVGEIWKTHAYWLAQGGGADEGEVYEIIRLANAFWARFNELKYAVRPWRRTLDPMQAETLLERVRQAMSREDGGKGPVSPEGN